MEIIIYKAKSGQFLLVPSCFLPSQEAVRVHGPMRRHGRAFVSDANPSKRWQTLVVEIDRCTYAIVTAAEAGRIFTTRRRDVTLATPLEVTRVARLRQWSKRSRPLARLRAGKVLGRLRRL